MSSYRAGAVLALLLFAGGALYWWSLITAGHAGYAPSRAATPLRTISFPASGAPEAQPHFPRGVLWLHNMGYEDAIDAFREALRIDPGFVMAYWGEALSHSQPLWFHEDPNRARAVLARLAPTTRLAVQLRSWVRDCWRPGVVWRWRWPRRGCRAWRRRRLRRSQRSGPA